MYIACRVSWTTSRPHFYQSLIWFIDKPLALPKYMSSHLINLLHLTQHQDTPDSVSASMASFASLPADVRLYIMDFLPHYKEANSLVKTCRNWHDTAVPRAYHHVHLRELLSLSALLHLLDSDNVGMKYIRHVTVMP